MDNTSDNIKNLEFLEIIVRLEEKIIDIENELTIQRDTFQKIIKTVNKLSYAIIQMENTIQDLGKIEDVEIIVKEKNYMQNVIGDESKFTTEELIQKVLQVKENIKEIEELEKELKKNKHLLSPGTVGEA